jgi:protein SCO1/2
MRTAVATLLILSAAAGVLWQATDGGRALTTEAARRLSIRNDPRPLPPAVLEDAGGERFRLASLRGRPVVLDFFYSHCPTLCISLGYSLAAVYDALPAPRRREIAFVSISFDPERDTPQRLAAYADRFGGREKGWRAARPVDPGQLDALLATFGVTVIPTPLGGYEHNAAVYVIDREGRLARVFDYDDPEAVVAYLQGEQGAW